MNGKTCFRAVMPVCGNWSVVDFVSNFEFEISILFGIWDFEFGILGPSGAPIAHSSPALR